MSILDQQQQKYSSPSADLLDAGLIACDAGFAMKEAAELDDLNHKPLLAFTPPASGVPRAATRNTQLD